MISRYLELVRFSHTFFAMPFALASMLLAAGGLPSFRVTLLIILALVFCRNVAMAFNRLADAGFDAQNPRTAKRHIPAGLLSKRQVGIFIIWNALGFVAVTWFLNDLVFMLSLPTLLIVCAYSLMKRISWVSHFFLGLAIGISPLGAWLAVTGEFHALPILLGFALLFWIAGFDILYATQDVEVDKKLGLHSLVTRLGIENSLKVTRVCHLAMLALLWLAGVWGGLSLWYQMTLGVIAGLLLYINFFRKSNSLDDMNQDFFLANAAISSILLVGVALSVFAA